MGYGSPFSIATTEALFGNVVNASMEKDLDVE
jgi:hypothetical protein